MATAHPAGKNKIIGLRRRFKFLVTCGFVASLIFSTVNSKQAVSPPAIEDRAIYYDDLGLIVHKSTDGAFDGGDTAQREGWYWLGVWIRNHTPGLEPWTTPRKLSFDQVLRLLEPRSDGVFVRHPKQYPNAFDKDYGLSRDQMIPLVAAMGVWGKQAALRRLYDALPEDIVGKHAFNGNYRNWLGQDGQNCSEIKKRGCDATQDCSLKTDNRDCSLKTDNRDCSLQVDARDCSLQTDNRDCSLNVDRTDCSLQEDRRSCGHDLPFGIHVNDPICESAKAAQNAGYGVAKAACEASKSAKNLDYAREKATCESAKSGQNALYSASKASCESAKTVQNQAYAAGKLTCESGKAGQNALYLSQKAMCEADKARQSVFYATEKAACEVGKTSGKYACEVDKQLAYQACRAGNVFSGDLVGPSTVNLFRRAFDENPLDIVDDTTSVTVVQGGVPGEAELLINSHLRVGQTQHDKDNVGDDLNHVVMLLMAKLRFPTLASNEAVRVYAEQRPPSYGSYLGTYYKQYGNDMTDTAKRIDAGIAAGWVTDVSSPYGAVRWYHRPNVGANPQLAKLYQPIIDMYIK